MNKKVLCVIDYLCAGGAQRQLVSMAVELKKRGFDVSFLVYHEHDFFKKYLEDNSIPIYLISSTNYLLRLLKLRRFIRQKEPQVVISFLEASSFISEISTLPKKAFKLIVGERNANPNILKSVKLRMYRLFHGLADYIVANSKTNVNLVKQVNPFLSGDKFKVIYNMVDFDFWKHNQDYQYLTDRKFKLVVLARYHSSKNLLGLLKAVQQLDISERLKLKIDWYGEVGDDSYQKGIDFIEANELSSIITLHEETKNVLPIIQNADCVGLFSFYEGLPNAMCEAMAVGKPIMYSNVSDLPEIIGVEEYTFNPNSTNDIARTLSYFLKFSASDLHSIGMSNQKIAQSTFSKNAIIDSYVELF